MPRIRPLALLALATCAVLVTGCGGSSGGGSSDEDAVKQTFERFLTSIREGDGAGICDALTPAALEEFVKPGASEQCSDPPSGPGDENFGKDAEIRDIEVDGDRATASVAGLGDDSTVVFVRDGDAWKLDGDQGAQEAAAKANARTAQTATETYAVDHNGKYTGVTPARLAEIEPTIETEGLTVTGSAREYEVTSESRSGATYGVKRSADGVTTFPCSPAGSEGCPESGSWV